MKQKRADRENKKTRPANNTSHQRAILSPEVQTSLNSLRENWAELTREQRGEYLARLIAVGCSVRGIAKAINQPPRTLDRYVPPTEDPEAQGDWEGLFSTLAKRESSNSGVRQSPIDAARESLKALKKTTRAPKPISKDVKANTPDPPLSHRAKAPAEVSDGGSEPRNSAEGAVSKVNLVELYLSTRDTKSIGRLQRLADLHETITPRPIRNARSLPRQSKPVRSKDSR